MRAPSDRTVEALRSPGNRVVEARRTSPDTVAEQLRAPDEDRVETLRGVADIVVEEMGDIYSRQYPLRPPCTRFTRQGVAGLGAAGCMVAGLDFGYRP